MKSPWCSAARSNHGHLSLKTCPRTAFVKSPQAFCTVAPVVAQQRECQQPYPKPATAETPQGSARPGPWAPDSALWLTSSTTDELKFNPMTGCTEVEIGYRVPTNPSTASTGPWGHPWATLGPLEPSVGDPGAIRGRPWGHARMTAGAMHSTTRRP